jgi:ferric-dicitrate binding protein FerR (iron transport regulator)
MDETLLLRFLMHRCNPAELKQIEQWTTADKANADWLFEMERIWGLKDEWRFSDTQEVEKAYRRFLTGIGKKEPAKRHSAFSWPSLVKYAAAVAVIALLSANLYYMLRNDRPEISLNTVEVPKGQRTALTLSDGTKVWLNSQSTFTYPSAFSTKNREVTLVGEGFFEVVHKDKKPFIVHSSLLQTTVLGTKFNVKAYPEETAFVTLSEGKVEVSTTVEMNRLTLKPNQQVAYSEETGLTLAKKIDPELVKSWTVGELSFVDQPLSGIAADLERQFDVQIRIQEQSLAEDIFTCRFKETATIEQILLYLKETKRLDYKINGRQIRIINYKQPAKKT